MLSRVANAVYWLNRYVERAENVARFLSVNQNLTLDLRADEADQWRPLVITTGDQAAFEARYDQASPENVMHFLTFDRDNPNSILSSLTAARENARSVREIISSEMWEQINRTYLMVSDAARHNRVPSHPHDFYQDVKMASHLFVGLMESTMSHNEAWHFGRVGRLCERADKTARIVDVKYFILLPSVEDVGSTYDTILWSALLKSASAFEMYRKRYRAVRPEKVCEFLILDRQFPRSMAGCLVLAESSLHSITGTPIGSFANAAERTLGQLRWDLAYAQIDEIIAGGLHEYLDNFQTRLNRVGQAIHQTFFAFKALPATTRASGQ